MPPPLLTLPQSKAVLGRLGVRDIQLSDHEAAIAGEVVHPVRLRSRILGRLSDGPSGRHQDQV